MPPAAARLPGLLLCLGLGGAAVWLREASGLALFNPIVLALAAGLALRAAMGERPALAPGVAFATRPLLRLAIVLLGLQITLDEVLALGPAVLAVAVGVVAVAVPAALWFGRWCGVNRSLALLLGVGTGICGASAIVAAAQVVRARAEEVTAALAVITLWGTAGLLLLPALGTGLGLDARSQGLWAGAALQEVVQAVGAAAAAGPVAAEAGTVMKLARVMLLAPVLLLLGGWLAARGTEAAGARAAVPVPWFALGFAAMAALASTGLLPAVLPEASRRLTPLLLATSIAGLGLATPPALLRRTGWGPLVLGGLLGLLVSGLALLGLLLVQGG